VNLGRRRGQIVVVVIEEQDLDLMFLARCEGVGIRRGESAACAAIAIGISPYLMRPIQRPAPHDSRQQEEYRDEDRAEGVASMAVMHGQCGIEEPNA
jgi:hypothetical protein